MTEENEYSVVVNDAKKTCIQYKNLKKTVFTNVNIKIPTGIIYALLGPSGCGKTTLFRCLLGIRKLDSGSILIYGHPPNTKSSGIPGPNVGYMPQELAVYDQLTIGESMWYFGSILGLSNGPILSKTNFLINLLRLPPSHTQNKSLSGGQLRRVSFALALLHEPRLMVLDEPTVGLDPIIRHRIWTYLTELCHKRCTTIVLSTHYIEEARAAHMVGMMCNGRLVMEGLTDSIIANHGCTTLEDTFLKICLENSKGEVTEVRSPSCPDNKYDLKEYKVKGFNWSTDQRSQFSVKWRTLMAIIVKNFFVIYRFRGALLSAVFLPSLQMLVVCYALGNSIKGIDLNVINEDTGKFGDLFLSYMKPEVTENPAASWPEGLGSFKNGVSYGVLHIKTNFSTSLLDRSMHSPLIDDHILNYSKIHMLLDNTNSYIAFVVKMKAIKSYHDVLGVAMNSSVTPPLIFSNPDAIQELQNPVVFWLMSGAILVSSYFFSAAIAVLSSTTEISCGHIERNYVAGISSMEIILGFLILQVIVNILQNIMFLMAALPVLLKINRGSYLLIFCMALFQSLGGFCYGLFFSVFCANIYSLFITVSFMIVLSLLISGTLWPLEAMPHFLRYFALSSPFAVPRQALDFVLYKGWDFLHFEIFLAFGVITSWMILFLGLSVWYYRKRAHQD